MSFQRIYKNKIHSKPPKVDIVQETNLQQVPECSADRFSSAAIKNQNFFIDDEDLNLLNTKHNSTNMKTLIQQEQTITSQLLPDQQSPATELLTENGKEDGPLSSDVRLKEDEDQLYENQPSPENKRLTKLNLLRRQDSIPVVVSEFHQIESHLDDDRNNGFKNEDDNNSERTSGIMVTSNTNFVPSKFAPDHLKKNISQATFTLKSPKQNTSGDQYIQSLSNKGEQKSIE